jgi:hypothetical protein
MNIRSDSAGIISAVAGNLRALKYRFVVGIYDPHATVT